MPSYVINTEENLGKRKLVKKYGKKIPIQSQVIRGHYQITGYRKYKYHEEVDIIFEGEIYVFFDGKRDWFDSSFLKYKTRRGLGVSKIKVNRLLRKNLIKKITDFVKFFDIELKTYHEITKLKWK